MGLTNRSIQMLPLLWEPWLKGQCHCWDTEMPPNRAHSLAGALTALKVQQSNLQGTKLSQEG